MLGALIGAGASLASSLLGNKENAKARNQEYQQQKEFAQSGIQWKAEDARKAGIHPLYAMGANTVSYAPQSVGGSDFSGLANAGQEIGRSIDATRSSAAKIDAFGNAAQKLQLEGLQLDNDLKRAGLASSVAKIRQAGSAPGLPTAATRWLVEGQGDTPSMDAPNIKVETRRDASEPGHEYAVAGASPDVAFTKTPTGGYAPIIPQANAESYEQDWQGYLQWMYRNRILPAISKEAQKPNIPYAPDEEPVFNPWTGEWKALKKNRNIRYAPKGRWLPK